MAVAQRGQQPELGRGQAAVIHRIVVTMNGEPDIGAPHCREALAQRLFAHRCCVADDFSIGHPAVDGDDEIVDGIAQVEQPEMRQYRMGPRFRLFSMALI